MALPLHVLNVSALLDPISGGGTAERTVQLSRAFAVAGWETTALCVDTGFDQPSIRARVGAAHLEVLGCWNRRFLLPTPLVAPIAECVRRADIVHLCNHWTVLNVLVARVAQRLGKPYVICPAGALPLFGRSHILKRAYNALAGREIVMHADGWVAITEHEAKQFTEYGVDASLVEVIPNGTDAEQFANGDPAAFRRRLTVGDQPIVLFLGRLHRIKGPDLLIHAFARIHRMFPDHLLVIAGPDDGQLRELRLIAERDNIAGKLRFTGFVGWADKASAYRSARLVVVPSRQEAMSLIPLEAGICGVPVLLTDSCGFNEVAANGGEVVAADVDSIARGLRRMLDDPDLPSRGERLRQMVARFYTWEAAVARYGMLFESVLARRGLAAAKTLRPRLAE